MGGGGCRGWDGARLGAGLSDQRSDPILAGRCCRPSQLHCAVAGAGGARFQSSEGANIKEEFISFQAIRGINIDFIDLIMGQMTPSIDHVKYFICRKTGAGARRRGGERVDVLQKGKKNKS